jgi:hypothetical protein
VWPCDHEVRINRIVLLIGIWKMIAGILMIKWIVEVLTYVVTHFWAPRAGDGVYLFWTKCRSLVHDCWGIDKSREKKKCFPNPVSAVFYSLYSPPFATKIIRFLRLIRCLYNANSFLFIWPLRLDKSLRICTKKNWFCRCRNSVAIPILFQLRLLILTWFRAISSYSNYTLSFMTC